MASPSIRPSALKGGQSGDPHRALVFWSQRGKLLFETALAEYSDRNNGEVRSGLFAGGGSLQRTRLWSPIPWLLGKNTGNLSRIATGTLLILRDIKDLPIEFPSS
jgi:hypothetical protein